MANNNQYKLQSAERYLASITGKPHAAKNASNYWTTCKMLIDAYKEKLSASVLKKHKHLATKNLTGNYGNPLYANMNSTYVVEKKLTLLDVQTMYVNALHGKFDKKFIKELLDSTENYFAEEAKKSSTA
tara:strand:+ start:1406 stop:1792 length:387 start_codon:yes stop_codon:yes gene_type:complete